MDIKKRIKNALRIAENIEKGRIDSKNLYDLLLHLSEANIELEKQEPKAIKAFAINDLFLKAINHGYLYREDYQKPGYENWTKTTNVFFEKYKEELVKIGWNPKLLTV